jgi:hypothetical protein
MSHFVNYTEAGYDDADGLINGRWMRDTWGVVVWVQIGSPQPERDLSNCGTNKGYHAHHRARERTCEPCRRAHAAFTRERKTQRDAA